MTKRILILTTGLLVGILLITQWRSYSTLSEFTRTSRTDIFQEIALLVGTNQSLRAEIDDLQEQKSEYQNAYTSQEQLKSDLKKARMLTGAIPVTGYGIRIQISATPTLAELTDLLNEIFQLGAEAVSINDIRLTANTVGLASYDGQLVLGGEMLTAPFQVSAIGDSELLYQTLSKTNSTLDSIRTRAPESEITVTTTDITLD